MIEEHTVEAHDPLDHIVGIAAREQHQMICLPGQALDHPRPEPQMLLEVHVAEVVPSDRASCLSLRNGTVRVGRAGEHHCDSETSGNARGRQRADISHTEMQHIEPGSSNERSSDASLHHQSEVPLRRQSRRLTQQTEAHRCEPFIAEIGDQHRCQLSIWRGPTYRQHRGHVAASCQHMTRRHEQIRNATGISCARLRQATIQLTRQRQLSKTQTVSS